MKIYTARACWNAGWWTSTVDEVEGLVTTTRLLEEVPTAVTSGLMNLPEKPIDYPEDALVLVLPEMTRDSLPHLSQVNGQAQAGLREAVRELYAQGLTFRDIDSILTINLTHATQLARRSPPA